MIETDQVFSDDDVVNSVREGNTRNFEILIHRYKHKIINFIYRMIYDYDEAQSLCQDVFLKVFEALKKYKMQDNFQAFVFTIAKNLTLNHLKKHKRVLFFSGFTAGAGDSNGSQDYENRYFQSEETQHAAMEREQQEEMLIDALKTLSENQRIALIMKVYLDFSYHQIADITGWSIPKIETLISRAKSNLRDKICSSLKGSSPKGGGSLKPKVHKKSRIPSLIKIKRSKKDMQEKQLNGVL